MAKEWSWDFTPEKLEPQLGRPNVGFWEGAGIGFQQGLDSTIPGLGLRHLKTIGGARISKEEFEQTAYARSGLKWNNRMTWAEADAAYEAKIDKELYDDATKRMTGGGKVGEFAGSFAGAVLDPVNLLPLGSINVARGFATNVAKMGAINAALEATLYQPIEGYVTTREQQPYSASQYALNVAMAAGIGGLFGGAGYSISKLLENRALRLGELGESTPAIDNGPVQAIPNQADGMPLNAPTSAVERAGASQAPQLAPNAANATPVNTAQNSTIAQTAQDLGSTNIRFPDANHQRFYNIDPNKVEDLDWLDSTGYTLADVGTYREAVARRIKDQESPRAKEDTVPAPHINSVNFERTSKVFTDPDFAEGVQARITQVAKTPEAVLKAQAKNNKIWDTTVYDRYERVLQEEQQGRAERMAALDDPQRPVPVREPEEGVLTLSRSKDEPDTIKELSVKEWLRRTMSSDPYLSQTSINGPEGRRLNWEPALITRLQRLTPEQMDYALFRLINEADLNDMTKHLGGTPVSREANARFIQEQIQPRGREYTPSDVSSRVDAADEAEHMADLHKRLDAEEALVNTDAVKAHDAFIGIDTVKTAADADKFLRDRFDVDQLKEERPAAALAAKNLERLQKRQTAILETMACLLGTRS